MEPEGFDRVDVVPVDEAEIERLPGAVTAEPVLNIDEDFEMAVFGAQKVLVVERFDRQWIEERWVIGSSILEVIQES